MESLEHAMKRGVPILAEFLGGAVNCDAYHITDPRADGLGVSSCMERCLEDSGVSPEEVIISFFSSIFLLYGRNNVFIGVLKFGLDSRYFLFTILCCFFSFFSTSCASIFFFKSVALATSVLWDLDGTL